MKTLTGGASRSSLVKVMLADTKRWGLAARLAMSLAEAGCEVTAIAPAPAPALMKTRAVQQVFGYSGLRPLQSLADAITAAEPDIIVPVCDRSVEHLHELYVQMKFQRSAGERISALIERSLGPFSSHSIVSSRYELLTVAREEGVHVPRTSPAISSHDLDVFQTREPFPWVMKADGTWGGEGVRIVHSREAADRCFAKFDRMYGFPRAIKRLIVNRDPFWIRPWWNHSKRAITIQSHIHGRPANCTAVCWKGRVLAAICVEVVSSEGSTGPANVVRVIENAEMIFAAERIASRLRLSGFFGLDFMIEEGSDAAYLIEMNPRTTPPCHLQLGKGRDLAGALWSQLADQPLPDKPPVTNETLIAYFPYRPAGNGVTMHYFEDIPGNEPDLVRELLNPFPDRTFLLRLVHHLTRKPTAEITTLHLNLATEGFNPSTIPAKQDDSAEDLAMNSVMKEAGVRLT